MKSYSSITDTYKQTHGLTRALTRNEVGESRLSFLTKEEVKNKRRKGLSVITPELPWNPLCRYGVG